MKKLLVILCALIVSLPVFGQMIDQSELDFSKAELAIAGPDEVYVTNILYEGETLSVLLKWDGGTGAIIYGPWFSKDKVLQDSYELGYASVQKAGTNRIMISDIIIGSSAYTGTAVFDGESKLLLDGYWEKQMPMTPEMRVKVLQGRLNATEKSYNSKIAALEAEIEADKLVYESKIEELQADVEAAREAAEEVGVKTEEIIPRPTRIAASGFTGGRALSGSWTVTSSGASQTDSGAYFSKYMIPISQRSTQTLYTFEGEAGQSGFVGYGLHFFASGDQREKGYGFGESYLVWLTRDPDYYGTDLTYLQLYKSYDDIKMVQAASRALPYSIDSNLTTELLYDRTTGKVTVWVNGAEFYAFTIPASERLSMGSKVALRALGKATFTDFTIKTR